jgi:cell division protein FtsB
MLYMRRDVLHPGESIMNQSLERFGGQRAARWGVRVVLVVLCVLVGLLGVGFVQMAWLEHDINAKIANQTAMNDAQRARNKELEEEGLYRESDAYAELAAREQLGMARLGETVLLPTMVTPPLPQPSADVAVAQPRAPTDATPPNYQRWWSAFFPSNDARP